MSEETHITLKHPVTYQADKYEGGGSRELTEIRLPSRVKAKHLRAMDEAKGEIGKALAMVKAMTGLPQAAIDELDAEDVVAAVARVGGVGRRGARMAVTGHVFR